MKFIYLLLILSISVFASQDEVKDFSKAYNSTDKEMTQYEKSILKQKKEIYLQQQHLQKLIKELQLKEEAHKNKLAKEKQTQKKLKKDSTTEEKQIKSVNSSHDEFFENGIKLQAYKFNYFLPYSYRTSGNYRTYTHSDEYQKTEVEAQISLKIPVVKNILGMDERYYLGYTQQVFWQLYSYSSPFRENNYNPEVFVVFPIKNDTSFLNMKTFKFAIAHKSNGQGDVDHNPSVPPSQNLGNRSRSTNYVYATLGLKHSNLKTELTAWAPFTDDTDNPDLMEYTGYTSVKFTYLKNRHMVTLEGRMHPTSGRGAVESTYSYPILRNDIFIFAKVFSGYAESLIDYDNYLTKFSVGFSFSR